MSNTARIIGTTAVLMVMPLATVLAQTQSPPASPQSPPAATVPQATPPATPQATSPPPPERKFAAPSDTADLAGLIAKSSDGMNLGTVYGATMDPGGKVTRIALRVGGFLGFGAHMVILPEGSFRRVNDTLQVNMTRDDVNKLPRVKE
jgi:hypothetical protein